MCVVIHLFWPFLDGFIRIYCVIKSFWSLLCNLLFLVGIVLLQHKIFYWELLDLISLTLISG